MSESSGVFQVMMLDVLQPAFEMWLKSRGLTLQKMPHVTPEELEAGFPGYVVGVGDELMAIYMGLTKLPPESVDGT